MLRIPHQSVLEFVAATTRGGPENRLLDITEALREAEELMALFPILYPDDAVLRTALRGTAAYGLSWFDARAMPKSTVSPTEDFQHGRMYGTVTVRNPFLSPAQILTA
ncbi:MAG: hypothetical protein OXM87_04025 [Truepera sp.]|nr:hypothetical protein [Truepera sp.]